MERMGAEAGEEVNEINDLTDPTEAEIDEELKKAWGKDAFEKTEEIVKQGTRTETRTVIRKLAFIHIDLIIPCVEQPRKVLFKTEKEFKDMVNSIKAQGNVVNPVLVIPYQGKFMLVSGGRRTLAFKEASEEMDSKKIFSIIKYEVDESGRTLPTSRSKLLEAAIITNEHQRKPTAVEDAIAYKRWMDLTGGNQAKLAARLGKSSSDIANALKLLKLNDRILKDLMFGKISRVLAHNLASFPKDKQDIIEDRYNEILNGFGGKIPSGNPSEWVAKTLRKIAQKMGIELLKSKTGKTREFIDMVFDSTNRSTKRFTQLLDDLNAVKIKDITEHPKATFEIIASLERLAENIEDTCVKLKGRLNK